MRVLGIIMRAYSLVFHLLLALFMVAVASIAWISGTHNLQIWVLPWQGASLTYWMFFSGLAGLLLTFMAFKKVVPIAFFAWTVVVFVMLARGYFFSSYHFGLGSIGFMTAVFFVLAALAAAVGGWFYVRRNEPRALWRKSAIA